MLNIINSIKLATKAISKELKTPSKAIPKVKYNTTGDLVKPIDTISNNIFIEHLSQVESIAEPIHGWLQLHDCEQNGTNNDS